MTSNTVSVCLLEELKQTKTATATRTAPIEGLMSRTMAVHVRYKSLYISQPSSAKQQRELIKLCVFWGTRPTASKSSFLFWN